MAELLRLEMQVKVEEEKIFPAVRRKYPPTPASPSGKLGLCVVTGVTAGIFLTDVD